MKSHRVVVGITLLLAMGVPVRAQMPLGSEFRVDTYGASLPSFQDTRRSAAMGRDGQFIVTWLGDDVSLKDVHARRFDASGRPQGPEILVNTYTTGRQSNDSVAVDDQGNFVVAWAGTGPAGGAYAVYAQRFDRSGARSGAEFRVSEPSALPEIQPMVAVAPAGPFVVVWLRSDGDSWGIFGRRFDASGTALGGEFQVNTYTTGQQYQASVDTDAAGNFVVSWIACCNGPQPDPPTARAQRYAAGGTRQGGEFLVSSDSSDQVRARLARSRDGSFVVAWAGPSGIVARKFDAVGTPVGPNFVVNDPAAGGVDQPAVDADADGDLVFTWQGIDGSGTGVFARHVDSSGTPGPQFQVNTHTTGWQLYPVVGADPNGNFVIAWQAEDTTPRKIMARRYAAGLMAAALSVDPTSAPNADGNRVLEPGETVVVAPSWLNANPTAQTFAGTATSFTGPGTTGDPVYTIADATASYGSVATNATASCTVTGDCYAVGITVPTARPAVHWDARFREEIAPANLGALKNWDLHVGDSFSDVPRSNPFYRFVETLLHHGVTGGCTSSTFCPAESTSREQMAVFVLVAKEGSGYAPPACTTPVFDDVPASSPFCRWIEELARRGVVAGCGGGSYCPTSAVARDQMAVFVLRTLDPALVPPACTAPMFSDVPATSPFCRWIEELARRGVVTGCGGGAYCPAAPVTREQMGVFLSATFGLQLYGP